jgi:hypothetical protein
MSVNQMSRGLKSWLNRTLLESCLSLPPAPDHILDLTVDFPKVKAIKTQLRIKRPTNKIEDK